MAYASISGRAKTNPNNPQAHARCDRCGFIYQHCDLRWQFDWRGATMQNTRVLVCTPCYDSPQEQGRAITVPADPIPIINPRVESYVDAETDFFRTLGSTTDATTGIPVPGQTTIVTQSGLQITPDVIGRPGGLAQGAVMPLQASVTYGAVLPVVSVLALGNDTVQVTCSSAHGLSSGAQVSVLGLANPAACGFYTVTVISSTAFSYEVYALAVKGAYIGTSTTRIITCSVGAPYNYSQIPVLPERSLVSSSAFGAGPANTVAPAISGTPFVGFTLTVTSGTWSPTPTSLLYQWYYADTGAKISGATGATYTPVAADAGHKLVVYVTAVGGGGVSVASSNVTSIVTSGTGPTYKFNVAANSQYAPFSFL